MYQKVATLIKLYFSRYFFKEFTYILIILKGCYNAGNTYFTGPFWEATSKNNTTVRTQLEDKIFIYSHKRINTLHYTGSVLQD